MQEPQPWGLQLPPRTVCVAGMEARFVGWGRIPQLQTASGGETILKNYYLILDGFVSMATSFIPNKLELTLLLFLLACGNVSLSLCEICHM